MVPWMRSPISSAFTSSLAAWERLMVMIAPSAGGVRAAIGSNGARLRLRSALPEWPR